MVEEREHGWRDGEKEAREGGRKGARGRGSEKRNTGEKDRGGKGGAIHRRKKNRRQVVRCNPAEQAVVTPSRFDERIGRSSMSCYRLCETDALDVDEDGF